MIDNRDCILFLVEGSTDKKYIHTLWERFDRLKNTYAIQFIHLPDLTAKYGNKPNTIKGSIIDIIDRKIRKGAGYDWKGGVRRIKRIVHLLDTDGAYIPQEAVREDPSQLNFHYDEEYISYYQVTDVINRNGRKKKNLAVLIDPEPPKGKTPFQLNGVPYHVYYMSCNIEHMFWGKEFMSLKSKLPHDAGQAKGGKSDEFIARANIETDAQEFLNNTIFNPEYAYQADPALSDLENYIKSWDFIKEGTNSLKRHTNLNLFFRDYIN